MAVMTRGANVPLTREIPGLEHIVVGVAWNAGAEPVLQENLVLAAILCDQTNRAISADHFVFFNQLRSPDMSVSQVEKVMAGDQEQVEIDLPDVPPDVARVAFVLYVNEGTAARRTLGQLRQLSVSVRDATDNRELVRSENLAPVLTSETALVLAEVYRHRSDWKFKVIGEGYTRGVAGVAADYGLPL